MAIQHLVKLAVTLTPVKTDRALPVKIGIDQNLTEIKIAKTTTINFEFDTVESCQLNVELIEKQDQEAVIIDQISFFGITDPKFAWAGVYEPQYPEPWATEQRSQGQVLESQLCPHTYLGWPGKWTLTFSVPVFTWIHRTQNLGWIYG
jgi:hypothetical protein